jgi:hypothetical protein
VSDYKISYINAKASVSEGTTDAQNIVVFDALDSSQIPGHSAVYIGEVKLPDFKRVLESNGYKSDLYGGILITANGRIALKKVRHLC